MGYPYQGVTPNEFQRFCVAKECKFGHPNDALSALALGLAGETGEVVDIVKKRVFHARRDIDIERVREELGDVLFYVATLADKYGFSLESVFNGQMAKLQKRYPNGFNTADAEARRDEAK